MTEARMRTAVTQLVNRYHITREEAWVQVRTHGVAVKGLQFFSNTPNAQRKRKEIAAKKEHGLCITCGDKSEKFSRCLFCRRKHAEREARRIRQIRSVKKASLCA